MKRSLCSLVIAAAAVVPAGSSAQAPQAAGAAAATHAPPLLKVAFVVTEKFNLLDVAGPWAVFGAARRPKEGGRWEEGDHLYEGYLISDTTGPIHAMGGATVTPAYTFADAPKPDIIVVGAQTGNPPEMYDWLQKMHAEGRTILTVCIGAIKLARLGILDGLPATTHHDYIDEYEKEFPKVTWVRGRRYVRSSESVFTSGGHGMSGIDLALHVVDLRMGRAIAQGTADYLEHHGEEWKQDDKATAGR